jgi:hypothetical protein
MAVYHHTGTSDATWTAAGNWDPGTGPPGAGDIAIFNARSTRALTGNPAGSPQLAAIKHYMSCTFAVGTPSAPIAVCADNVEVGLEATDGSSGGGAQFHINTGTNIGSKFVIYNTPSTGTTGLDPVTIKTGTPSSGNHTFHMQGGTAGIATGAPGDAATIATIVATGGRLNLGSGMVTGWGLTLSGSGNPKVFVNSATSGTVTQYGGQLTSEGIGLIATVVLYGGSYFCNHRLATAIITTLTVQGGTFDASGDGGSFIVTNYTRANGTVILASPTQMTVTTPTATSFGNYTKQTIGLS